MNKSKIPNIWKYYFFFGFGIFLIHFIRYLNFYINNSVPTYNFIIDYGFYSNASLFYRIICLIISLILLKLRKNYPIFASAVIWNMIWLLMSHEYEKYLFLAVSIFSLFNLISLISYKFKLFNYD